ETADDGAAVGMRVFGDGQCEALLAAAGLKAVEAFHLVPAVVFATVARCGLQVDLFVAVLSNVADPQIVGSAIEAEAPGIAEPIGPDLALRTGSIHEGIGGRDDRVAGVAFHIDAEKFSEQGLEALAVAERVATGAAVAHGNV